MPDIGLCSHRDGIISILQCCATKDSVASALLEWDSFEFEQEAARRGLVATAYRTFDEWDASPQGEALKGMLPVLLRKVADAPPREPSPGISPRPLNNIKTLDLTRVLAGPVCGRTLAGRYRGLLIYLAEEKLLIEYITIAHGADVLWVTSPNLPNLPLLDADTSRGKRTTQLDLTSQDGRDKLTSLVRDADVFLQAYRPGGLANKGFGVDDVVRLKEGKAVVYASLRAYGWEGPWKHRRGVSFLVLHR